MCLPRLLPIALLVPLLGLPALADEVPVMTQTIRNHQFEPPDLEVPAGQKIELHVTNAGTTASEWESSELHREKIVPPGETVTVYLGPLRAGRYEYFDDFNPQTRGYVIAK